MEKRSSEQWREMSESTFLSSCCSRTSSRFVDHSVSSTLMSVAATNPTLDVSRWDGRRCSALRRNPPHGQKSRSGDERGCSQESGECLLPSKEEVCEGNTTASIKLTASPEASIKIVSSSVRSSLQITEPSSSYSNFITSVEMTMLSWTSR